MTALAGLQKEIENVEDSTVQQDHEEQRQMLERCASLPHLKWKGTEGVRLSIGDGDNIDNISVTSATKSEPEDRVKELVRN